MRCAACEKGANGPAGRAYLHEHRLAGPAGHNRKPAFWQGKGTDASGGGADVADTAGQEPLPL